MDPHKLVHWRGVVVLGAVQATAYLAGLLCLVLQMLR
jgi:hypothetical protein